MPRLYTNMIDYVLTERDSFAQRPVCRVDSLVFSWLAYLRIPEAAPATYGEEGMTLRELYRPEWLDAMCGRLYDVQSSIDLLQAAAQSPRFRDVVVSRYVSLMDANAEQQFSAMTFKLGPSEHFLAFRGTDNTLVGWKEDFNMSFATTVPSQLTAVRYLERVAGQTQGRLWCGGHSKGGNLAVYAGVMCDRHVRGRVVQCFSHDGPGFSEATMADPRWSVVDLLVDKTIPQSSVIGMIFERQEREFMVVHSHNVGFNQHDPFSWEVNGRDFERDDRLGSGASLFDATMNATLAVSSLADRERLVDLVFRVLNASGETCFGDIKRNWKQAIPKILLAVAALDAEDRKFVQTAVTDILRAMVPDLKKTETWALLGNSAAGIYGILRS